MGPCCSRPSNGPGTADDMAQRVDRRQQLAERPEGMSLNTLYLCLIYIVPCLTQEKAD